MGIYAGSNTGFSFDADVSLGYDKNIFSLQGSAGSEANVLQHNDNYTELNLLYGRSLLENEAMRIEFFVGAGYFHFNTFKRYEDGSRGEVSFNTVGFTLGGKLLFELGPRYSMGMRLGANINAENTLATIGLLLQWNGRR